jgi:hypothetical protein
MGAVVATGSASVNADCDNGVTLHYTAQPRRGHEHAAKRVEASVVLAQLLAQGTSVEDEVPEAMANAGIYLVVASAYEARELNTSTVP